MSTHLCDGYFIFFWEAKDYAPIACYLPYASATEMVNDQAGQAVVSSFTAPLCQIVF